MIKLIFLKIRSFFFPKKDSSYKKKFTISPLFTKENNTVSEIRDLLIKSDVSIKTITYILNEYKNKEKFSKEDISNILKNILNKNEKRITIEKDKKNIILIFGINGVGKTTSIGKLIHFFKNETNEILIVGCDTFRASAVDQLNYFAKSQECDFFSSNQENKNPGAILYDALNYSKSKNHNIIIVDTAGRLENKINLMDELKKLNRIIYKNLDPDKIHIEKILVLDSNTGKNAIHQGKEFHSAIGIDGIILTKFDSSSKAGIILSIVYELNIPLYFIGTGEKVENLLQFNSDYYIQEFLGMKKNGK